MASNDENHPWYQKRISQASHPGWNELQGYHMINHACDYDFKARCNIYDQLREYLHHQDVGHNQGQAKHDRYIEDEDKVFIGV